MTSSNIPSFWLKLLPEHIDQNVDAFLSYLSGTAQNDIEGPTAFSESTALLEERCIALASGIREGYPGTGDSATLRLALRLFGAKVLLEKDGRPELARKWFALFIEVLAYLVPSRAVTLCSVLTDAITSCEITGYGFGWKNVTRDDSPEVIAEVVSGGAAFSAGKIRERWYQGSGTALISGGTVALWSLNRNGVRTAVAPKASFSAAGGRVQVMDPAAERLRSSEKASQDLVAKYMDTFIGKGSTFRPSPDPKPGEYQAGDTMAVRYIAQDHHGNIVVETVDPGYRKVKGVIRGDMPETRSYNTLDLMAYLYKGDVFPATWQGALNNRFDIITSLPGFLQKNVISLGTVEAICKGERGARRLIWFTEKGFPVSTAKVDGVYAGDYAILDIISWDDDGFMRCNVVHKLEKGTFTEDQARQNLLRSFTIPADRLPNSLRKEDNLRDGGQFASLARVLLLSERQIESPSERLDTLVTASLLASVAGDTPACRSAMATERHLQNLIRFVKGKQSEIDTRCLEPFMDDTLGDPVPDSTEYVLIDSMLKSYGTAGEPDVSMLLPFDGGNGTVARLCDLYRAERQVHGLIPEDALLILRRKVCDTVRISLQDTDGLDRVDYIGPESGTQEQKTSFLIAPKDAPEQKQERTVARVIDAFLNCETGGTLYIGVSDEGYVRGIDDDFRLAERLYPDKKGMDGYLRLIRMILSRYFSQEVLATLRIEPVFDGRAVAVRVPPYPYGVVELEGTAWYRFGPECLRMGETLRERIDKQRKSQTNVKQ